MALVGFRYIQSTDPGAVGFGYEWADITTGNLYARNTSNSAWTLIGNANQATLGNLSRSGGHMLGALTGATGLAPVDSPDFTTAARLSGVNLATTRDIDALRTSLSELIDTKVSSGIAASTSGLSVSNNLAIGMGRLNFLSSNATPFLAEVPFPAFPDATATAAQCKWSLAIANWDEDSAYPGPGLWKMSFTEGTPTSTGVPFTIYHYNDGSPAPTAKYPVVGSYVIIATR